MKRVSALLVAGVIVIAGATSTVTAQSSEAHKIVSPQEVKWGPAPAELPAGAQAAVLFGDPRKESLFVLRLKLPKGYRVAPHTHSVPENRHRPLGDVPFGHGSHCRSEQGAALARGELRRPAPGYGAPCLH